MIFSNFLVAAKIDPGTFPDTPNDQKRWFGGSGTIQDRFWRMSKKCPKSTRWRLVVIFWHFFVAAKIDPGAFPEPPNNQKRWLGGSGTIQDWFWMVKKKCQKSSFLTKKFCAFWIWRRVRGYPPSLKLRQEILQVIFSKHLCQICWMWRKTPLTYKLNVARGTWRSGTFFKFWLQRKTPSNPYNHWSP